jgi:hypothetical protein
MKVAIAAFLFAERNVEVNHYLRIKRKEKRKKSKVLKLEGQQYLRFVRFSKVKNYSVEYFFLLN